MLGNFNLQLTAPAAPTDLSTEAPGDGAVPPEHGISSPSPFSVLFGPHRDRVAGDDAAGGDNLPETGRTLPLPALSSRLPGSPQIDTGDSPGVDHPREVERPGPGGEPDIRLDIAVAYSPDRMPDVAPPHIELPPSVPSAAPVPAAVPAPAAERSDSIVLSAALRYSPAETAPGIPTAPARDVSIITDVGGVAAGEVSVVAEKIGVAPDKGSAGASKHRPTLSVADVVANPPADDSPDLEDRAQPARQFRLADAAQALSRPGPPLPGARAVEQPASQPGTTLPQFVAEPRMRSGGVVDAIGTPVRQPGWGDQLGKRIVMLASNHVKSAEIRLTPADLGPLKVHVTVDDGLANVSFHTHHAVTREAIEQAMPRLREMLADSGLSLGQTDVTDQGVSGGYPDGRPSSSFADKGGDEAADDVIGVDTLERRKTVTGSSLVDTFV